MPRFPPPLKLKALKVKKHERHESLVQDPVKKNLFVGISMKEFDKTARSKRRIYLEK